MEDETEEEELGAEEAIAIERKQLDELLGRGVQFTTEKRSLLRYIGDSERSWVLEPPRLGTLLRQDRVLIEIDFSEEELKEGAFAEARRLVGRNARLCAEYIAIGVLGRRWGFSIFAPFLTWYFLDRITPQKLFQIFVIMQQQANYLDFIGSIRLVHRRQRRTQPVTPIETVQPDAQQD